MSRDSKLTERKNMNTNFIEKGRNRLNQSPSTQVTRNEEDLSEYPERISITLTRSQRKGPSFLFTNEDQRNNIDFEGSDDDPEASYSESNSEEDRREWERAKKLVKDSKVKKSSAIYLKNVQPKLVPTKRLSGKFEECKDAIEHFATHMTDGLEDDAEIRMKQPKVQEIAFKDRERRDIKAKPKSGLEKQEKIRDDPKVTRRDFNEKVNHETVEDNIGTITSNSNLSKDLQIISKQSYSENSKVDLQTFNDMAAAYKSKIDSLTQEVERLRSQFQEQSGVDIKETRQRGNLLEKSSEILNHLIAVEDVIDNCLVEMTSKNAKIAKLSRCVESKDDGRLNRRVGREENLNHQLEDEMNKLLDENQLLIHGIQSIVEEKADIRKKAKLNEAITTEDSPPRKLMVVTSQLPEINLQRIKSQEERKLLGNLEEALRGEKFSSLEDALERVRQLSMDYFNSQVISSTWSEKEKSLLKQLSLSKEEFARISDEKARLEGCLRDAEGKLNMLRIERDNSALEKKACISEAVRTMEMNSELSKLGRELEEKNQLIEKLRAEMEVLKEKINKSMPTECNPQAPRTEQRSEKDLEFLHILEYIKALVVNDGSKPDTSLVDQGKKLRVGPYGDHLLLLERLIETQAAKQHVLSETYRDKFLNDNILLEEIRKQLIQFESLLELIDESETSGMNAQSLLSRIQEVGSRIHRKGLTLLAEDVERMKEKNNEAIRDTVTGDLDAYLYMYQDSEPPTSKNNLSRQGGDLTFGQNELSPKQSFSSQSRSLVPFANPEMRYRPVIPVAPTNGQNLKRQASAGLMDTQDNRDDLMQLLVSQSRAITKYE